MRTPGSLAVLVATGAAAAFLTAGGSSSEPAMSPNVQAAIKIDLGAYGLHPGDRYAATFQVYAGDDDPYPYTLGLSAQAVRAGGTIAFTAYLDELTYSKPHATEVRMWLRPPGSRAGAGPSLDPQGRPLITEQELPGYQE